MWPVERSSTATTRPPWASNRSHRWEPMNPAAPVTRYVVIDEESSGGARRGRRAGRWEPIGPFGQYNGEDASGGRTFSVRTMNFTGTLHTIPGYDDVTGLGTPWLPKLVAALS